MIHVTVVVPIPRHSPDPTTRMVRIANSGVGHEHGINLLSDNELDAVAGGMMNTQRYSPSIVPTGGPRSGGGSNEAFVNAVVAFTLGGLYGLAADLAGLF